MNDGFTNMVFVTKSYYGLNLQQFGELFTKYIEDNNLVVDYSVADIKNLQVSNNFLNEEPYEYRFPFWGKKREKDDDAREQIEFMISQMPEL